MDNTCRICLEVGNKMISIYLLSQIENIMISSKDMIAFTTGLEVSKHDNLSQFICQNCQRFLTKAYKFRQTCWASNKHFKIIKEEKNLLKLEIDIVNSNTCHNSFQDNSIRSNNAFSGSNDNFENSSGDMYSEELTGDNSFLKSEFFHERKICNTKFDDNDLHIIVEDIYDDNSVEFKNELNENVSNKNYDENLRNENQDNNKLFVYDAPNIETKSLTIQTCDLLKLTRFCYVCDKRCDGINKLQTHMQNDHKGNVDEAMLIYKCFCNNHFRSAVSFNEHVISDHQMSVESNAKSNDHLKCWHYCYKCKLKFEYLINLKQHFLKVHKASLDEKRLVNKCIHCNKQFKLFRMLKNHVATKHVNISKCSYCGLIFNKNCLIKHLYENHMPLNLETNKHIEKQIDSSSKPLSMTNLKISGTSHKIIEDKTGPDRIITTSLISEKNEDINKHNADILEETKDAEYSDVGSILYPIKNNCMPLRELQICNKKMKCIKSLKNYYITNLKTYLQSNDIKKKQKNCETTLINTKQENFYVKHQNILLTGSVEPSLKVQEAIKKYKRRKCYLCEDRFKNLSSLSEHLTITHSTKIDVTRLVHECEICQRILSTYEQLSRHYINQHNPTYVCEICGKHVKTKKSLQDHINVHLGKKPYKCDKCNYVAAHRRSISIHMSVHSKERKYKCDLCKKTFKTASARSDHKRSHSEEKPFECLVCGNRFKQLGVYKEHILIHDASRHVACKYCGKKFSSNKCLKPHLKTHTGEKSHICVVCGKGFIQKHSWRNHLKRHPSVMSEKKC